MAERENEKIVKKIIKRFIAPIIILFSLYGLTVIWYDNAYDSDRSSGLELVTNGNETVIFDYTFTLENYVWWTSVLNISLQYQKYNPLTESFEEIYPDPDIYRSHNFTLHEVSKLTYFGEKIISEPNKLTYKIPHNYSSFYLRADVYAPPFTKAVTKVKFSYEYNREEPAVFSLTGKPDWPSPVFINIRRWCDIQYPFSILIPISLFLFSGGLYAILKKDILLELIDSFHYIKDLTEPHNSNMDKLVPELDILRHRPNLIDDSQYVFLTPTTTLFKMFVRRKITRRYHQFSLKKSEDAKEQSKFLKEVKELSKFLKDEHTKPSSSLLEFRVIALIVALLAAIGFTLTWNAPAIRPMLMAFGLLILCFNLGFLFYIFWKSKWEKFILSFLVLLIILVMILEGYRWNLTYVFRGISRFIEELLSSNFGY